MERNGAHDHGACAEMRRSGKKNRGDKTVLVARFFIYALFATVFGVFEKRSIMDTNNHTLYLELKDEEWPFEGVEQEREIVRAIVADDAGALYFVRANRDDVFGKASFLETSGGGVEAGEDLTTAIHRELKEELGATVEILCKLGVVDDYYNVIRRHNRNHYYLCKVVSWGRQHLTEDEKHYFRLTIVKTNYTDALRSYEESRNTKIGRLIANREIPVLREAKRILDSIQESAD